MDYAPYIGSDGKLCLQGTEIKGIVGSSETKDTILRIANKFPHLYIVILPNPLKRDNFFLFSYCL